MDQTQIPPIAGQAVPQMSDDRPATSDLNATPEAQEQPQGFDPAERDALLAKAQRADQLEAEAAAVREQNRRYEQQMAQQAAAAWRDQEVQMLNHARTIDPDDALQLQADFYRQREQALVGFVQQRDQQIHQERLTAYADYVAREHGLDATADKTRLLWAGAQNPDAMVAEAQRIKAERAPTSELETLRQKVEQLTRAQAAGAIRESGAWQTGGTNPLPVDANVKAGSRDQLKQLLAGSAGFPT